MSARHSPRPRAHGQARLPHTGRAEQREHVTSGPITLSANTTPSGPPAWKSLPSWTVVGTEDRVIPADTQRQMAERAGATITAVAGSHVSMVSRPQATIGAILAARAWSPAAS
jgi:pimeloyl-ACP methyl ester carboxylesterase